MERLACLTEQVETEFTIQLADDDFLIPASISKGIEFLDENLDFVSVQGKCFEFQQYFPESGIQYFEVGAYAKEYSLDNEYVKLRLNAHMSNYMHTFYSLQRSNVWKMFTQDLVPHMAKYSLFYQSKPAMLEFCQTL